MTYDIDTFTWGMELEFGDVPRNLNPPYSKWSSRETDIVNVLDPYYGIAADPIGIDPPVGGELNTTPSTTIEKQVEIFNEIVGYFQSHGVNPTTSCVSQTHVHVHIPNLTSSLADIKKLLMFIYANQNEVVRFTNGFYASNDMSDSAIEFLSEDNGRKYTEEAIIRILKARTMRQLYENLLINDGTIQKWTTPKRYFINFATLEDNETIEFRCFRGTVNSFHIENILKFCRSFLGAAFNNGKIDFSLNLPPLNYDAKLFNCWEQTKHVIITNRSKKRKRMEAIT